MKRYLFACLFSLSALVLFSACSKDDDDYIPFDGTSHIVQDIAPGEWERSGNRYTFVLDIPDLDEYYFQDGHVSIAISPNGDPDFYYPIPAEIGDHVYSAKYGVGVVVVYADYIGGGTRYAPDPMYMKVVLTDAEVGGVF